MDLLYTAFAGLVLLALIIIPLVIIYFRKKQGKSGRTPLIVNFCVFFGLVAFISILLFSQSADAATEATAAADGDSIAGGMKYIAAALSVGLSGIGGGIAVASSASAALGALSENDEIFGKSLIYVGLAEGVALYGLLIAFMLILQ